MSLNASFDPHKVYHSGEPFSLYEIPEEQTSEAEIPEIPFEKECEWSPGNQLSISYTRSIYSGYTYIGMEPAQAIFIKKNGDFTEEEALSCLKLCQKIDEIASELYTKAKTEKIPVIGRSALNAALFKKNFIDNCKGRITIQNLDLYRRGEKQSPAKESSPSKPAGLWQKFLNKISSNSN